MKSIVKNIMLLLCLASIVKPNTVEARDFDGKFIVAYGVGYVLGRCLGSVLMNRYLREQKELIVAEGGSDTTLKPPKNKAKKKVRFSFWAKLHDSAPGAYAKCLGEELAKRKEERKKRKKNHQPSQLVALT